MSHTADVLDPIIYISLRLTLGQMKAMPSDGSICAAVSDVMMSGKHRFNIITSLSSDEQMLEFEQWKLAHNMLSPRSSADDARRFGYAMTLSFLNEHGVYCTDETIPDPPPKCKICEKYSGHASISISVKEESQSAVIFMSNQTPAPEVCPLQTEIWSRIIDGELSYSLDGRCDSDHDFCCVLSCAIEHGIRLNRGLAVFARGKGYEKALALLASHNILPLE